MKQKIFASICLVSLIILIAALIGTVPITMNYCTDALKKELKLEASYLAYGVEQEGVDYIINTENANRITLISAEGKVVFDSYANSSDMTNHLNREEIRAALSQGEGYSVRHSSTLGARTVYYAVRLSDGDILRVASSVLSPLHLLSGLTPMAVLIFALSILFAVFLAMWLSKRIVKELQAINLEEAVVHTKAFPELSPILTKLSEQGTLIARQMEEIRKQQSEFEAITHNMADGLILIDSMARLISCNKSGLKILGNENLFTAEGENQSILSANLSREVRDLIRNALLGSRCETAVRSEEKIYRIIADPVINDGTVSGVAILVLDETEKENREELRREFTSNISHELKTPLTSISGFAELIRAGLSGENTEHFADNIYNEAQRLITLVNDIIKLSRLDGKEPGLTFEPLSLLETADSVALRLKNVANTRGISISVEGADATVNANSELLHEIIYNLCDNAIKYGNDGGYVKITVSPEKEIARLAVEDNGIGIPSDQLDRIFERFYRVDKSHSKSIGGTGLGLSIVKHGATCHNATLSIQSELGKGTRVSVCFPKTADTAEKTDKSRI